MGWKDSATPVAASGSWRDRSEAIAPDKKTEIIDAINKITSGNGDKIAGLMNGRFSDTGRAASSPGEFLDSIAGAPVRTALNEGAVKGQGLVPSIKAGLMSATNDPKNAPSGVDIAYDSGIKNPYAGAALGTLIDVGGQLPVAEGLSVGSKAVTAGAKYAGNALKDIAETRAFKALGPTKGFEDANQAKGLVNSIGRTALDEGVVSPLASKKTMLSRAEGLADKKSQELQGLIDDVSNNKNLTPEQVQSLEASKFVPASAAEGLKSKIRSEFSELPSEVIAPRLDQVDTWLSGKDPKNIQQAQNFKTQMSKFIKDSSFYKDNPGASQDVLLGVRNAAKEGIEKNADAYAGLLGQEGGAIKNVNRQTGNALEMGNILEDRVSRDAANRSLSLTDYLSAIAGHGALGWKGLLMAPVNKFGREKGSQIMATSANSISKLLLESPAMQKLAEKDPDAFTNAVSAVARKMYIERKQPMAAEQEKPNGFLNAQ